MSGLILIVEDEADLLTALDYNLQREGYTTRVAATGQAALEAADLDPVPDLVLLDLMLPDMSGTEVCRRLRSNERTKHISVVMVTAKSEEIDRVVGFEVGADDYVVKPVESYKVLLQRRGAMSRRRGSVHSFGDAEQVCDSSKSARPQRGRRGPRIPGPVIVGWCVAEREPKQPKQNHEVNVH